MECKAIESSPPLFSGGQPGAIAKRFGMTEILPSRDWESALGAAAQAGAEDVLLVAGHLPMCRIRGEWMIPGGTEPLNPEIVESWLRDLATDEAWQRLLACGHVVFLRSWNENQERLRVRAHRHVYGYGVTIRLLPSAPPPLASLAPPKAYDGLFRHESGIVLIGGSPDSGRSTLVAATVEFINAFAPRRILYLGNPPEFVFTGKLARIDVLEGPRENSEWASYIASLRDFQSDVVALDAELPPEALLEALLLGQSGTLVILSQTGPHVARLLESLVKSCPAAMQQLVRGILADSLRGVLVTCLLQRADGQGRIAAHELLLQSRPLADPLREGKWAALPQLITTNRSLGMISLDDSLDALMRQESITGVEAFLKAHDKTRFVQYAPPEWQAGMA